MPIEIYYLYYSIILAIAGNMEIIYNRKRNYFLEEIDMRLKRGIVSGLMALVLAVGYVHMPVTAAKIQCDQQIPAEEVESVYNQAAESNALEGWPAGPNIYSESGIVMDMDSGAVLYAKKIDEQHYPASITKLLTALVALENSSLTDTVKFTQDSISFLEYGDAHIGMKVGEEISMEDALYGMLLASANEVSYAIADSVCGYDDFIAKMNEKVVELGGTNSHFMNANGLHNDEHYTSARDMALIGSEVFKNEEFRKITSTHQHSIPETAMTNEKRIFQQNHKMLYEGNRNYYEYCVGGKTGFTDQALTTLVTFATKEDKNLVCVTLRTHGGGVNAYADTRAMLDYAFDNFTKVPVTNNAVDNKNVKSIAENTYVMLPQGVGVDRLETELISPEELGEKEGTLIYTYKGQEVGKTTATITDEYYNKIHGIEEKKEEDKEKQTDKAQTKKEKKSRGVSLFWTIIVICLIMLAGLGAVVAYAVVKKRKKKEARRKKARRTNQQW